MKIICVVLRTMHVQGVPILHVQVYLDTKHVTVPAAVFPLDEQSHIVVDNQARGQQPTSGRRFVHDVVLLVEDEQGSVPGLCVVHVGQRRAPSALQVWVLFVETYMLTLVG